jgi:8-oxo-dGTP pyrophosphatase MutT (NUDIX family)
MEEYDGAIGVIFRKRKEVEFLIIHNQKSGNYTFPAGSREIGENTSLRTIQREIREETGYEKNDYKIMSTGIIHSFIYGENKKERAGQLVHQPIYIAELVSNKKPLPQDPDATIDGWYNYKSAREILTFDDSKLILDKILALIK